MESGLFQSVLFSWEVVAGCIALMLLLPLVFYIASTRSRKKLTPPVYARAGAAGKVAKRPAGPAVEKAPAEDDDIVR